MSRADHDHRFERAMQDAHRALARAGRWIDGARRAVRRDPDLLASDLVAAIHDLSAAARR